MYDIIHTYITYENTLCEIMISYQHYIYEIMSWLYDIWNHIIEIICMKYDLTKPSYMISGMYDIIHACITYEIISYESILSYPYSIYAIMSWFHDIWNHIIEIICMGYDITKPSYMISGYLWYVSFKYEIIPMKS